MKNAQCVWKRAQDELVFRSEVIRKKANVSKGGRYTAAAMHTGAASGDPGAYPTQNGRADMEEPRARQHAVPTRTALIYCQPRLTPSCGCAHKQPQTLVREDAELQTQLPPHEKKKFMQRMSKTHGFSSSWDLMRHRKPTPQTQHVSTRCNIFFRRVSHLRTHPSSCRLFYIRLSIRMHIRAVYTHLAVSSQSHSHSHAEWHLGVSSKALERRHVEPLRSKPNFNLPVEAY